MVKEIDNISITSTESSCSDIIDGSDESNSESRILEKWKQVRSESIAQGKPGNFDVRSKFEINQSCMSSIYFSCQW